MTDLRDETSNRAHEATVWGLVWQDASQIHDADMVMFVHHDSELLRWLRLSLEDDDYDKDLAVKPLTDAPRPAEWDDLDDELAGLR